MGLNVGGGGVDVSEGADLGGRGDDSGDLGGGGLDGGFVTGFPRLGRALERLPKQSPIFFQFPPRCIFGQPEKEKW